MKLNPSILLLSWLVSAPLLLYGDVYEVKGNRVNLRALPDGTSEVVDQVSKGDLVVGKGGVSGGWIEVVPPDSVDLWVHADLVTNGVVGVSRARIRCGPGLAYRSVGEVVEGRVLDVKGQAGEWVRVSPPSEASLWISSDYVTLVGGDSGEDSATKRLSWSRRVEKPGERARDSVAPDHVARAPSEKTVEARTREDAPPPGMLAAGRVQGEEVEYSGRLVRASMTWRPPTSLRLVKKGPDGFFVECYVLGEEKALGDMIGLEVAITGRRYWVRGSSVPVVAIDSIVAR